MLGYELSIYGRTVLGSDSELNVGPNSVVKVNKKAWLIVSDGVKMSIEAREMVIASACVVLNDTLVEETIGVPKGLDQDPVPEQKFFGQPLVHPGLYCYDLSRECDEWNVKMDEIGYGEEVKVECKEEKVNYAFVEQILPPSDDKKN